jgi:hypothetical protein
MPLFVDMVVGLASGQETIVSSIVSVERNAVRIRAEQRRMQRQFWDAMHLYQERLKAGEESLPLPDINDEQSLLFYLQPAGISAVQEQEDAVVESDTDEAVTTDDASHEAADVPVLDPRDLSSSDRQLLRRYERANTCPESLQNYLPGFYELCLSVTEDASSEPLRGLINVNQQLHSQNAALPNTLKSRLQMIKEALDRSTRRTDGTGPMRPTPYIGE